MKLPQHRPEAPVAARMWAERAGKHKDPDREPRRRRRAGDLQPLRRSTASVRRPGPGQGQALSGHIKPVKKRTQFLEFCRYLRTLYPPEVHIAIVCDNLSPHLTTKKCQRVDTRAAATRSRAVRSAATSSGETATPTTGVYAPSSTGPTSPETA